MSSMTIIGIVLIVLGVVGLVYGGITYTSGKDVLDMGPMHVEVDQKSKVPISPIVGAVAVLIGTFVIIADRRRHASGKAV